VLEGEKYACFNMVEPLINTFSVYYLDERGSKNYLKSFDNIYSASEYMFELVKSLNY